MHLPSRTGVPPVLAARTVGLAMFLACYRTWDWHVLANELRHPERGRSYRQALGFCENDLPGASTFRKVPSMGIDLPRYRTLLERAVDTVLVPIEHSLTGGRDAECLYLFPVMKSCEGLKPSHGSDET